MTIPRAAPQAPPPDPRPNRSRSVLRGLGELLITLGLVVLLFVFYEIQVTSWFSARKQEAATDELRQRWDRPSGGEQRLEPMPGNGFARLYVPELGPEFPFTVLEGTDRESLAAGPGHYADTALPGQRGNFAVAGHRSGRMAPFAELDELRSCAALVVETRAEWFVYRVLPMRGEAAGWNSSERGPKCSGVAPIGGPYQGVRGRTVVEPARREVINPVPGRAPGTVPEEWRSRLITLTTCHPEYSADERMIVHGVLTKRYPKVGDRPELRPPELAEG
ncbi:class E sortase [Actinopolyspora sp. BKK1]|uniref:class E sortase n=1 Tax=unclassified Actinopolyspora TaxID=2639451 RepID=UPI00325BB179